MRLGETIDFPSIEPTSHTLTMKENEVDEMSKKELNEWIENDPINKGKTKADIGKYLGMSPMPFRACVEKGIFSRASYDKLYEKGALKRPNNEDQRGILIIQSG